MFLLLLALLATSVWAESFLYLHPANPRLHDRDIFPQQKSAPRGKIRDLPQSGIVYLNRIKPMDPFVKAFGSQTVEKTEPVEITSPIEITQEKLTSLNKNEIEEDLTSLTAELDAPSTTQVTPADLADTDLAALDSLLHSLKSEQGSEQKPAKLITLRGTRVAGSATAHRRPAARLVRLDSAVGSTATLKNTPEFDPWERMGQ